MEYAMSIRDFLAPIGVIPNTLVILSLSYSVTCEMLTDLSTFNLKYWSHPKRKTYCDCVRCYGRKKKVKYAQLTPSKISREQKDFLGGRLDDCNLVLIWLITKVHLWVIRKVLFTFGFEEVQYHNFLMCLLHQNWKGGCQKAICNVPSINFVKLNLTLELM